MKKLSAARVSTTTLFLALVAGCSLTACGAEGGSAGAGSTEIVNPTWPKRVTLVANQLVSQGDGVDLAEGTIVAGDDDLSLSSGRFLILSSPTSASICEKGVFPALGDVPTDLDACPAARTGDWGAFALLGVTTTHTSEDSDVVGRGFLLWDRDHTTLYRARVVNDSYDPEAGSTATFDYEPAP